MDTMELVLLIFIFLFMYMRMNLNIKSIPNSFFETAVILILYMCSLQAIKQK